MLFYNLREQKLTPSGFVCLKKFATYKYATLLFIGCNKKIIFNLVVVCEEKKIVGRKREIIIFFIILLGSLYYFIGLYVKIKTEI